MSQQEFPAGPQPPQQPQPQPPALPPQKHKQEKIAQPPPLPPPPPAKTGHLTALTALHYFSAALLFACVPALIWLGIHLYGIGQAQDPNDALFAEIGYTSDLFYPLMALLCIVTACFAIFHGMLYVMGGVWCQKRRQRKGLLALQLANALIFPIGTMISAYAYYVLTQPGIKALFED